MSEPPVPTREESAPPSDGRPSDLERLKFYREEIRHEFTLLSTRSVILVTCQSFLVVPLAILNTASPFGEVFPLVVVVALLGMATAGLILEPITTAHRAIGQWLGKQRRLLRESAALESLRGERDEIEGVELDVRRDLDHQRSLAFSRWAPWLFILFWACALVLAVHRLRTGA